MQQSNIAKRFLYITLIPHIGFVYIVKLPNPLLSYYLPDLLLHKPNRWHFCYWSFRYLLLWTRTRLRIWDYYLFCLFLQRKGERYCITLWSYRQLLLYKFLTFFFLTKPNFFHFFQIPFPPIFSVISFFRVFFENFFLQITLLGTYSTWRNGDLMHCNLPYCMHWGMGGGYFDFSPLIFILMFTLQCKECCLNASLHTLFSIGLYFVPIMC